MVDINKKPGMETTELIGDDVRYIRFKCLQELDYITHGFSTRLGGISTGELKSMNLSFTRGDRYENVIENYKRISATIGFDYRRLVTSDQTHTTNVRTVTNQDIGKGIVCPRDYCDVDGLITDVTDIPLVTYYADCVPLYFVDTQRQAIGLSHSGWKGTVGRIGARTIEKMMAEFGSNPEHIIACIGPSICRDCYEIGEDVASSFKQAFEKEQMDSILLEKDNGKYQLDLWAANETVLIEAGVLKQNIKITDVCTCCNKELLFTHRGMQGKRGNLAAFLMLV